MEKMAVPDETSSDGSRANVRAGITPRALIVGTVFASLVSFVTSWAELVIQRIIIGILTFPPAAFGTFVLLIFGNRLLRWARPRWALTPAELLVVYTMMVFSCITTSHGAPPRLIALMTAVNYYANPSNQWEHVFFPYIPAQLVPWNPSQGALQPIVVSMFDGLHQGEPIPWLPWVAPILRWWIVVLLVYGAFLCLATILRPQWSDREKLNFPLAQLPMEMLQAESGGPFYRHKLLYLGASIPVAVHLINLAHNINPNLPQLTLQWDIGSMLFKGPPLSDLAFTAIFLSFSAIGFFYMLPSELLFSFWFFFLLVNRGHHLLLLLLGVPIASAEHGSTTAYYANAEAGGFIVLAGYYLYLARGIVGGGWKRGGGRDEMMPYRTALVGFVICFVAAVFWYYFYGLSVWLALMEMVMYILIESVVMTRATAEGGVLMTERIFMPLEVYGIFARRQLLGVKNLTMTVFSTNPFAGDMRGLTLQPMMDMQKIGDSVSLRRRSLHATFWLAIVVALGAGFAIQLWLNYRHGALSLGGHFNQWFGAVLFQDHQALLNGEERFDAVAPASFVAGAAFMIFLSYMRLQYWWWPLHPLGFAMSGSWSLTVFWFPVLVAWLAKTIIVHYGGLTGYTKARPFFLGLIFGEMSISVILTLLDAVWHIPAPYIAFDV